MEIQMMPLGPLETNCYLVSLPGRDDCVIIDPGDDIPALQQALREHTAAAVLITHAHYDHILGLPALPGVPVYVHALDAPAMTDPRLCLAPHGRALVPAAHLLKEGDTVSAAGICFRVLHTPGHTPGSCCFAAEDSLFTGDTLFAHGYGRTDLPGGSFEKLRESLFRLLRLKGEWQLWPGHGDGCFLSEIRGGL